MVRERIYDTVITHLGSFYLPFCYTWSYISITLFLHPSRLWGLGWVYFYHVCLMGLWGSS